MASYRRILLKLSGEALAGDNGYGIDPSTLDRIAREIVAVAKDGVEVSVVVGGGNIFRGIAGAASGMDRVPADYMGMLATAMNSLAMQDAIEKLGQETRVISAITMRQICEPYIRRRAMRHLELGRVIIFATGTGNPYFTTDTAAALRAKEMCCEVILKATKVDGIYDADPKKFSDAQMLKEVSHHEALSRRLKVMDATALSLCMETDLPIIVFNLGVPGNIGRVVQGEKVGTLVHEGAPENAIPAGAIAARA